MLLPREEGGTWLDCVLPLPPDHCMCAFRLSEILEQLPENSKPHGFGHGFERLSYVGTSGGLPSCTKVPRNKRGVACTSEQRPLVGGVSILEWDNASSALHIGIVCACIPAAEKALELLPPEHPCRKATTRLAPYGYVYTYQAGKWYVTRSAAIRFPALVKRRKDGGVDSYDEETDKARTVEPHFDSSVRGIITTSFQP